MTQDEFVKELKQAAQSMNPLCGRELDSEYECHLIVNLVDGGSFENSIQLCGLCNFSHKYPASLHEKLEKMKQELIK